MTIYTYHIDLNERGYFRAHVENSRKRSVIAWDLPEYFCDNCGVIEKDCTCDEFAPSEPDWDIFSDWVGYVKHFEDVDGLERYLKEIGVMPHGAELRLVN